MNNRNAQTIHPLRRDVLRQLACMGASSVISPAFAQRAGKPVTMILPTAAGAPSDVIGRKLAQVMGAQTGLSVIADNRAGANGIIGVQALLNAPADGQTILFTTTSTMATNKAMIKSLPYEPMKDLITVGYGFRTWMMVAVNSKLPYRTVRELIDDGRANPGKLNFGYGTANPQLGGKLFEQSTGSRFTFVSYKSHAAMMLALMSGEVDLTVTDALSLGPLLKSGQVRVLAGMSPARNALVPDAPTMVEVGLPNQDMLSAHVVMVKAGTPPEVVARLGQMVKAAAESKEMSEWLPSTGFDSFMATGAEATAALSAEIDRIGRIARVAGLQPS